MVDLNKGMFICGIIFGIIFLFDFIYNKKNRAALIFLGIIFLTFLIFVIFVYPRMGFSH
jgi:hypothetical protein